MRKRLNTHQMILVAILLALILACGAVYAYMFMRTEEQSTQFIPAKVDCEVEETYGNNVKSSITVTNTGNIDAYIRIRLVSYWVDGEEKNIVAKTSVMPSVDYDTEYWVEVGDNTYYYTLPVSPDAVVSLLKTPVVLAAEDGYNQVVEVFAEAIQADPGDAVEEAWGVELKSDSTEIDTVP